MVALDCVTGQGQGTRVGGKVGKRVPDPVMEDWLRDL